MNNTLYLTVGLPRSGKSTWAKEQGWPIVNPDSIRLAIHGQRYNPLLEPYVWAIAATMVRALFLAGHNKVILDATNINEASRKKWKSPDWVSRYVPFTASAVECIYRAKNLNDEYIIPVIERMSREYELLNDEERAYIYETIRD